MDEPVDAEPNPETAAGAPEGAGPLPELTFEEARVLGCLLEKEMTTPENYPLSLNSLNAACNQRSNRDPIVGFDGATVTKAMEGLRYKQLAITVHEAGARVPKSKHIVDRYFPYLRRPHFALLAELLVRGPQTLGELRQRTERMHPFADLAATQASLDDLIHFDPHPLVRYLPAGAGRRVASFMHLLCGDDAAAAAASDDTAARHPATARSPGGSADASWREEIESAIEALRGELAELRAEVARLRGDA